MAPGYLPDFEAGCLVSPLGLKHRLFHMFYKCISHCKYGAEADQYIDLPLLAIWGFLTIERWTIINKCFACQAQLAADPIQVTCCEKVLSDLSKSRNHCKNTSRFTISKSIFVHLWLAQALPFVSDVLQWAFAGISCKLGNECPVVFLSLSHHPLCVQGRIEAQMLLPLQLIVNALFFSASKDWINSSILIERDIKLPTWPKPPGLHFLMEAL